MSLSLLQSYSSAEEEEGGNGELGDPQYQNSSDDEENCAVLKNPSYKPLFDPNPPPSSTLPSAFDAFSEVVGPPRFLNNHVQEEAAKGEDDGRRWRHGVRRNRRDKKDLPAGAVVESKAHLVGIHERVRSDAGSNIPQSQNNGSVGNSQGVKRVATAGDPNLEDAAELLRMCVRCGIPKTYSHTRGIVCPVCGDRPPTDTEEPVKKKESTIKDKEKSKRMKGQSSHATWKSETEMQLRQQFD
ncbi:uncharacterized protein LOC111381754 [Olea europaea var. sylvestris]|uniref:Uncharacterized protein n=1 Tax=Olea europaea subsp. europaea TaxID=158383 RepID=A0A8S0QDT5_OLEEU|nr:uncharacterized protein LOC111381754 [Olea europaea var. sylvestris]CAA2965408.1 Hypothetical predicted protein [Olea europaea subsp. europaea]